MTNSITLAEGVQLHIIATDKFTTNILCILIRLPLRRSLVTKTALLPALLSRGSAKYPTVRDIRLATEAMQGSVFDAQIIKKGEQQILQFFLECTPEFSGQGLDFLAQILLNPRIEECPSGFHASGPHVPGFHAPYVESEAINLKNRIEGRINNKSDYAKLKCLELMCSEEPFGIYGDGYVEDLAQISPEGLLKRWENIKTSAPIDFIALGRWDEERLKEDITSKFEPLFNSHFSGASGSPVSSGASGSSGFSGARKTIPRPLLHPARSKPQTIHLNHSTQGNLCMGLRGEIPSAGMDFIHFQLANEILGGGPNAKLFANVREKESLCYSIYSTIYRFKSLMCVIAGTEPDKLELVAELALKEIDALKGGKISADDLSGAKSSLSKRWRAMQDNPSACVDFCASQYLLGDPSTVEELLAKVDVATVDGVVSAASKLNVDTVVMMR